MAYHQYNHPESFRLESGAVLPGVAIGYSTYGKLSPEKDNVIWVFHALTANSEVADWWPHTVEKGKFLDPERWFVVCANFLGSHYGTTGPLSINPDTGQPWYAEFPEITVRDMVHIHHLLAVYLGIHQVELIIGASIGGFQCLEAAIIYPGWARQMVLVATAAFASPWTIALNESQRMVIEADPTFGGRFSEAGAKGLSAARSIALLSYRGPEAYNTTQAEAEEAGKKSGFRAASYQRYQGEKLSRRFNAYSYYRLTQAVDSHNIARGRGRAEEILQRLKPRCCIIAIDSDLLFPPSGHIIFSENIPDAEYHLIASPYGHDGFLVEYEKINIIINRFLEHEK